VALLEQFKREVNVAAAVKAGLGVSTEEFDRRFNEFVGQRYGKLLGQFDAWKQSMVKATQAAERGEWSAVVEPARAAIDLYGEYVGGDSPYLLLARAYEKNKQPADALAVLLNYRKAGGWEPDALRDLARLLMAERRNAEAIEVLEALNYGDPLQVESHLQLADALLAANRAAPAVREYRALLALKSHDAATAYFGLARALRMQGDAQASRRNLLQALEAAPNFRPAQELLLQSIEERE
jgi:cellulose synthase operon protein C